MMVHDPYAVEPRKPLTAKQKLQMFVKSKGVCCICGGQINGVKETWDEHVNPLWLAGDNSAPNRAPAHAKCARAKTAAEATERASIRRKAEKHFGAHRSANPMPCGRKSKWKKKMDGSVVPR